MASVTTSVNTSGTSSNNTPAVILPSGFADGSTAYVAISINSTSTVVVVTPPTGWTLAAGPLDNSGSDVSYLYSKTVNAVDGGSTVTFTLDASYRWTCSTAVVTAGTLDQTIITQQATSTGLSWATPGFTCNASNCLAVSFLHSQWPATSTDYTLTWPSGWTVQRNQHTSSTGAAALGASIGTRAVTGTISSGSGTYASAGRFNEFLLVIANTAPDVALSTAANTAGTGSSNAPNVVLPSGIASGSIGYMSVGVNGLSTNVTLTPPAGWTILDGPVDNGGSVVSWLLTSLLSATDSGTRVTASLSAGGRWTTTAVVVANATLSSHTVTTHGPLSTSWDTAAYTAATANSKAVVIEHIQYPATSTTYGTTWPSGWNEARDVVTAAPAGAAQQAVSVGWRIDATSGAKATTTGSTASNSRYNQFLLSFDAGSTTPPGTGDGVYLLTSTGWVEAQVTFL